ncbi:hypothetical protein LVY72_14575 [Arthrobacter sp. I2-34]|uniref:Uncharacterized protein n=1 Tax=Arthrobacter hankyongi TaxID=2904801 RepID=A0ABS9L8Y1_9MICC|nr:hypothetical protein [Arthrobacter hankyongi]MCG2623125.1 hypothetical protein [Arthrobacter hankyongi]
MEKPDLTTRFMHAMQRLMNVFGPADSTDSDTPVVHRHDDAEMASDEQLADLEVEHDNQGHSWALRKKHPGE